MDDDQRWSRYRAELRARQKAVHAAKARVKLDQYDYARGVIAGLELALALTDVHRPR